MPGQEVEAVAEVNVIYQKIILEFLFELYVFYALTTRKLNRAPRFWIRTPAWPTTPRICAISCI